MISLCQQNPRKPALRICRQVGLCLATLVAVAFHVQFNENAVAASGDSTTLPIGRMNRPIYSKDTGLQIEVDSTWAGKRGYRPVRVTVRVAKAATADTQLTIQYYAGSWQSGNKSITVEKDFELAQGATSATTRFSVPQYLDWNGAGWEVWVDGVKDEALGMQIMGFNSGSNGAIAVGRLGIGQQQWSRNGSPLIQSVSNSSVEEQVFTLNDLPDTWVDYSPLDVFTATVNELEMLHVSAPAKLESLLRWVRAGGNLWVLDVGEDYVDLPRLNQIITSEPSEETTELAEDAESLGQWKFAKLNDSGRTRLNDLVNLTMDQTEEDRKLSRAQLMDSKFPDTAADSRQWFVVRAHGLGTIVAMQESTPGRRRQRAPVESALERSALIGNLHWANRHGNDPGTGNPNFNNWLIADVGAAPVFEFQLLITLFAIAIGPVNYWLLKRRNQLPVLLLTVPIAALATTLILFAYGILADGVGARLRARSVTMLDQNAGESASWARLSYYAGIAPSDGLQITKDTAVYPILPSRSQNSSFGRRHVNQQRSLEWTSEQRLTRGWLASRTPTQYLSLTARPTQKRLEFESKSEELKVSNQLGANVSALIVQDHEGKFFLGENIEAGGNSLLKPSEHNAAASVLRRLLTENLPQLPPGYVESNRRRGNNYGASMIESLMELQFEAMNTPTTIGWGNGTYIAITSQGVELPLGLEKIEETESFHVVRGTW